MKRALLFITCILASLVMLAQEYVYDSILSESKVWTLIHKPAVDPNLHSDIHYIEEMKLVGDTVIDGIHFGQIYNREWRNDKTMPEEWRATDKYIGQDGGKVYQYFGSAKKMRLDMDFSLQVGDKFGCKFFSSPNDTVLTFVVTAASDTIMESSTDRKPRKCIHIQSESYPDLSDVWIEGVGSLEYGLLGFTYYFEMVGAIPRMAKCTDGNDVLYQTGYQEVNAYRPLLEEGKVWQYSYNNGVRQYMKSLTIDGDTIIGDQTYKKIIDVASQGVEMFLREEGKKVYCCYPNRETEILLYDFGKNAGEIISRETRNGDTWIQKVVAVDTIMVKDNSFRCMTVHEYGIPEGMSEETYFAGNYGYESGFWVEGIGSFTYLDSPISYPGNYYSFYECQIGDVTYKQKEFLDAIKNNTQPAYRPFVEEGKVWKVGAVGSGNPVQLVDYYYFDGDTIIDGKTCKQMMCQRYVTPDFAESNYISQDPPSCYVGAWYEEDKKVYFCNTTDEQFKLMYDFSVNAYDTLQIDNHPYYLYVVGPRQTGGIRGFKGVFREVRECGEEGITYQCAPWLEGVGIVYGPPTLNVLNVELADPMWFLMSCTVGDEVIYLNDVYDDGATPESMGARKRFDFTHTIKTKPKSRMRSGENQSLHGEYNDLQLGINLNPLDDAYLVRITDDAGKVVYEKSINAGNIVGLNIDISAYAKGRYTVIVENSDETYTGEFDAQTTGIRDVKWKKEEGRGHIYNLQGQRLSTLQKGLNIVNGQKIIIK